MGMHEGFDKMEARIREELGLDESWEVEATGSVRGNACSEVAVYPKNGSYAVVSMDRLMADFPGTMDFLRDVWDGYLPRKGA